MLDNLKLTVKNSLIYSLGNVSLKITGLILIPIYTNPKYLSVEDYGILGMLEIVAQLVPHCLSFHFSNLLTAGTGIQICTQAKKHVLYHTGFIIVNVFDFQYCTESTCQRSISDLLFKSSIKLQA